jgi:hypothetical protein
MAHKCTLEISICCYGSICSCSGCFRKWNFAKRTEFGGVGQLDLYTEKLELGDMNLDVVLYSTRSKKFGIVIFVKIVACSQVYLLPSTP